MFQRRVSVCLSSGLVSEMRKTILLFIKVIITKRFAASLSYQIDLVVLCVSLYFSDFVNAFFPVLSTSASSGVFYNSLEFKEQTYCSVYAELDSIAATVRLTMTCTCPLITGLE